MLMILSGCRAVTTRRKDSLFNRNRGTISYLGGQALRGGGSSHRTHPLGWRKLIFGLPTETISRVRLGRYDYENGT